jgi:signal transduction histidine kinase
MSNKSEQMTGGSIMSLSRLLLSEPADSANVISLAEMLARIPRESGFPSGARVRVTVHGRERELRADRRDQIYRIGCEAIVNACRHSQARAIEIEVEYRALELRIAVADDGCGIDPRQLPWEQREPGGLQGMREGAERIGARLRLRSRLGLGTEVVLRVPGQVAFPMEGRAVACRINALFAS